VRASVSQRAEKACGLRAAFVGIPDGAQSDDYIIDDYISDDYIAFVCIPGSLLAKCNCGNTYTCRWTVCVSLVLQAAIRASSLVCPWTRLRVGNRDTDPPVRRPVPGRYRAVPVRRQTPPPGNPVPRVRDAACPPPVTWPRCYISDDYISDNRPPCGRVSAVRQADTCPPPDGQAFHPIRTVTARPAVAGGQLVYTRTLVKYAGHVTLVSAGRCFHFLEKAPVPGYGAVNCREAGNMTISVMLIVGRREI
jgi:hypothetical protein